MKKYIQHSIFVLFTLTLFTSCEKVIDLDLNKDDAKFIIEGQLFLGETDHSISIKKTLNFDETIAYPTVDNAQVTLSDNQGNSTTLTLSAPGMYSVSNFPLTEGTTYTLSVVVDGKTFTASSTMPNFTPLDEIFVLQLDFGGQIFNSLVPLHEDEAGIPNYYQFHITQNSERLDGIYLQDDDLSDGLQNQQPIFAGDFQSGDTAIVTMFCIDRPVYKYFFALDQNTGGATPANPESNFGKACLGYFSVRTKDTKTVIIP